MRQHNKTWEQYLAVYNRGLQSFAGDGSNIVCTIFWRAGIFISTTIQTRFSILRYIATISNILITNIAKYMYSHFNNTTLMRHLMLLGLRINKKQQTLNIN